eukprot:10437109-Alexandrium_andersonii.AAC.1
MDPRAVVLPSHEAWAGRPRPIATLRHDWYECVCKKGDSSGVPADTEVVVVLKPDRRGDSTAD